MTEKDMEKLAELAKIRIPEGKTQVFLNDFSAILDYVKQIESVQVDDTTQRFSLKNITRSDKVKNERGEFAEDLLSSAPQTQDGFVQVNKIL
ncbi:MAG: Asp-tRNA(Asn)/Glu-tRNA(Gln) amidotransferase subunit GatC [Bacteroidetes bacterium]|nr:Asp-tRNA(Asn)/Glu-tRNA(Gln) amidotransferase subunit GatC [Bacteroidota bacterium]